MTDLSSFLDISAICWSKPPVKVGRVVGLLDTNYSMTVKEPTVIFLPCNNNFFAINFDVKFSLSAHKQK